MFSSLKMIRRILYSILVGVVCISAYILFISKRSDLNIILISVDTLSAEHMGIYGYDRNTTPHIDSFAQDAVVFKNTYTLFPITPQSFYTLFTGKEDFLKNSGNAIANVIKKPPQTPFLSEIVKGKGFRTAAFVTNPVLGTIFPTFKKGFSTFEFSNFNSKNKMAIFDSYIDDYKNAKIVVKSSIDWLNQNKKDRFFLWAHFDTPHMPYNPPNEYIKKIDNHYEELTYRDSQQAPFPSNTYLRSCSTHITTPESIRQAINLYDAEIVTVDEQVGILLNKIKRLGLYDTSIIVFYSDHGEGFDHNAFGHGDALYEAITHIPFIVRDPRYPKSKMHGRYVSNKDILPTLLNLLQIRGFKTDGYDLSPIIRFPLLDSIIPEKPFVIRTKTPPLTELGEQVGSDKYAAIADGYKYIYSLNDRCTIGQSNEELYNLKVDRKEKNNIIKMYPEKARIMQNILKPYLKIQKNSADEEKKGAVLEKLKSLGY